MKLTCEICKGICCYNPPQIADENEYKTAKKYVKEYIRAFKLNNNDYALLLIKNNNNKCPFLENGKCKIYNERFNACKVYRCRDYEKDVKEYSLNEFIENLENTKEKVNTSFKIFKVDKSFLEKENIEIININEIMEQVYFTDVSLLEKDVNLLNQRIKLTMQKI